MNPLHNPSFFREVQQFFEGKQPKEQLLPSSLLPPHHYPTLPLPPISRQLLFKVTKTVGHEIAHSMENTTHNEGSFSLLISLPPLPKQQLLHYEPTQNERFPSYLYFPPSDDGKKW